MTANAFGPQELLFKNVSSLIKQGDHDRALQHLRDVLRRGQLDPEGMDKAGRMISKNRTKLQGGDRSLTVWVLGQCTTSWLATSLTAVAWGHGTALNVLDGDYDNILQDLISGPPDSFSPDVIVFVPWIQRLLSHATNRPTSDRIDDEMTFWSKAWNLARQKYHSKILQVGYDWTIPGPDGHHLGGQATGNVGIVRRTNESVRAALPPGAFFLDLEQVSGMTGRDRFYDARRYFWTKQPFSEAGTADMAMHIWAGIRALRTGPQKVLVVDLDNTLWGGVVGETGPLGIEIGESPDGEAFVSFQRHLKALTARGVVLAICSKNNREDALAPFQQNSQMILKCDDFAHIEATWEPKDAGIRRISQALNLGLDSFVFFDDNPAERELIRQKLPEVAVVDVPADPAEYVQALSGELWFEAAVLVKADAQRAGQYRQERDRRELKQQFTNMDDYLRSLEMRAVVEPVNESNMQRVVQLLSKTNQFNLTTRRHGQDEVVRMLSHPASLGLTVSLVDRFGEHGLVSLILAVPLSDAAEPTLLIDTWLMSCRAIGRTLEQFAFNALVEHASRLNYRWVIGEYIPTKKNQIVADLYDRLGFVPLEVPPNGPLRARLSPQDTTPAICFIAAE